MGAHVKGLTNGMSTDPLTLPQWVLVQQQKEATTNLHRQSRASKIACSDVKARSKDILLFNPTV